jgi:hypothetical protein
MALNVTGLPPGNYLATITAVAPDGGTSRAVTVHFRIVASGH